MFSELISLEPTSHPKILGFPLSADASQREQVIRLLLEFGELKPSFHPFANAIRGRYIAFSTDYS